MLLKNQNFAKIGRFVLLHILNYISYWILSMEELYTFNSRQLQIIKNNSSQLSSGKYRKKILSCNRSSKISPKSKLIPFIQKENQKLSYRVKSYKKVKFAEPIEKVIEKKLLANNQTKFQETKSFFLQKSPEEKQIFANGQKNPKEGDNNRPLKTFIKRAFSAVDRGQIQEKSNPLNELKKPQNDYFQRKEKKSNSLKLSPKINFPISDRKLPSAFKLKFGEKYLQKIIQPQVKLGVPRIPLVCQRELCLGSSRQNLAQQIQNFKRRLTLQSYLKN